MPAKLKNYDFPQVYAPWYVYSGVVKPTRKIERYDIVTPLAGEFGTYEHPRNNNGDINLNAGYAICTEEVEASATATDRVTVQLAMPGSVIPAVADDQAATGMAAGALVKPYFSGAGVGVLMRPVTNANLTTDVQGSKIIGRIRVGLADRSNVTNTSPAGKDRILVQTGLF